jgi:hypothetical protein
MKTAKPTLIAAVAATALLAIPVVPTTTEKAVNHRVPLASMAAATVLLLPEAAIPAVSAAATVSREAVKSPKDLQASLGAGTASPMRPEKVSAGCLARHGTWPTT